MRGTFGAFKGLHAGRGIYWSGTFNVEGDGEYRTIKEARARIDEMNARYSAEDLAKRRAQAASGNYLVVRCVGDGRSIETPDGLLVFKTMREFRQNVFDVEEKYSMETVSLADTC